MKFILGWLLVSISARTLTHAQQKVDSIYTFNKVIVGKVIEVGQQEVLYSLPNEEVTYQIYKRSVLRIAFSSGREEVFIKKQDLPQVRVIRDWENVKLTTVEEETKGLTFVDMVSVKATGPFIFSSVTNTQNRALRKLKYAAAMLGGDKVFITNQSVEGNIFALRTTRTQVMGIVYRTAPLDTVGLSKNVIGGRYKLDDKSFLNIDNAKPQNTFVTQTIEVEIKPANFEFKEGIVYLRIVDLGLGVDRFVVTFQSQSYIVAGRHSNSRFVNIVLKRVKQ